MKQELQKLKQANEQLKSLIEEVENFLHIPKRFRKLTPVAWNLERPVYVAYLNEQQTALEARIKQAEDACQKA